MGGWCNGWSENLKFSDLCWLPGAPLFLSLVQPYVCDTISKGKRTKTSQFWRASFTHESVRLPWPLWAHSRYCNVETTASADTLTCKTLLNPWKPWLQSAYNQSIITQYNAMWCSVRTQFVLDCIVASCNARRAVVEHLNTCCLIQNRPVNPSECSKMWVLAKARIKQNWIHQGQFKYIKLQQHHQKQCFSSPLKICCKNARW